MWKKIKKFLFNQLMKKMSVSVVMENGELRGIKFKHPAFSHTWTPEDSEWTYDITEVEGDYK